MPMEKKKVTKPRAFTKNKAKMKKGKNKSKAKGQDKSRGKLRREKQEIGRLLEQYEKIDAAEIKVFSDFPLSERTRQGLDDAGYQVPTEIQRVAIGQALQGNDILGAAKTGSGKTLAFLIPILECLYRNEWSTVDGLGALVISPTRELAYQTFEVLCKIGARHDFSAGLIIGGKDLRTEMERIPKTNIIVCTPGRLLQHMDETACFESLNLKMLVLDEADCILDLGFQRTLDAILDHLPQERQTLLFSATQTKSVRDLARLSLQEPRYVAVHEHHQHSTPVQLEQSYIVCEVEQKLDVLYSFIKAHLKQKILVFMSSCKQVKYVFEAFCKLNPGISVMALYGSMHQLRRVAVYEEFCIRDSAVLLATDIAARGLDFPAVHWVVQLDCPEDCSTYIHRVGRTARYEKNGEALLVLLPSEEPAFLTDMAKRKIPIEKIQVNPNKKFTIEKKLQSYCAQNLELKQSAQRAFISYLKSVYLMKNKEVFDVHCLSLENFAKSLGLAVPPRVRFINRAEKRKQEQSEKPGRAQHTMVQEPQSPGAPRTVQQPKEHEEDSKQQSSGDEEEEGLGQNERAGGKYDFHGNEDGDSDENDDLLVKKTDNDSNQIDSSQEDEELISGRSRKPDRPLTKYALAKKIRKKNLQINTKKVFDDEGEVSAQWPPTQPTKTPGDDGDEEEGEEGGINIEKAKEFMMEEDKRDKQLFKERVKEKHLARKMKEKKKQKSRKRKDDDDDDDRNDEGVPLGISLDADEDEFDPLSLPDPDKFSAYVDDESDDGSNYWAGSESPKAQQESPPLKTRKEKHRSSPSPAKRKEAKATSERKRAKKQKVSKTEEEFGADTGLSLQDDEQLALHMLSMDRF